MTDAQPPPETTGPSAKAMGKRAVTNNTADMQTSHSESVVQAAPPQTAVHSPPKTGMQTRKRVMPARSRRGGPGVGGCDVDIMILETRKRRCMHYNLLTIDAFIPNSCCSGERTSTTVYDQVHPDDKPCTGSLFFQRRLG